MPGPVATRCISASRTLRRAAEVDPLTRDDWLKFAAMLEAISDSIGEDWNYGYWLTAKLTAHQFASRARWIADHGLGS
jgi:hypothetical protein